MKKYSSFNQLIVRYLFTILAVVLLGANALADTVWTAGDATVDDLLTESNWSNGSPVTADNPGFITGNAITVSNTGYQPGGSGQNISLNFGGTSQTTFSGNFYPFGAVTSGSGAFTMRLDDSASVTVNNFWAGNTQETSISPVSGNDYVVYQYYGGNSTFNANNEWWGARAVKTYIQIADNASVTAGSGNSGLGCYSGSYGSVLDVTGGSLTVLNLVNQASTINVSGGTITATGTTYIGNSANTGTSYYNQTGGKVTTAGTYFSYHDNAVVNISGGSYYMTGAFYSTDQAGTRADINISGTGYWKTSSGFNLGQHGNTYLNVSDDAVIQTGAVNYAYHHTKSDTAQTEIVMSDNALWTCSNNFTPFWGIYTNGTGAGYASVTLKDHARLDIANNMWGGGNKNDNDHVIQLLPGKEYALEENFQGNSTAVIRGEWWTAVTAKTHVTIQDNASVSALSGNAGMGWGSLASGSVLDMTGGNLLVTANYYWVGSGESGTQHGYSTMNQSGGTATVTRLYMGTNDSAYNLSGGVMNAGEMSVYSGTSSTLTGGTLNVGTLSNVGTTTLNGTTVNLGSHGYINSTGTFNAQSGAINVKTANGYSYSAGDQILIGSFADEATANAAMALTSVPSGWTKGVVDFNGTKSVIAQYGSAPTGVKVWTDGAWTGETSNNTGYVVSGTNTFNEFSGQMVVLGGTNNFADTAVISAGKMLVVNGGTNTYGVNDIQAPGTLIVNGGSFATSSNKNFRIYGTAASPAYMEVNGGAVNAARWLAIGNANSTTQTAKVVINNGIVQCGNTNGGGLIVCDGTGVTAELVLNGGRLQVNNSTATNIGNSASSNGTFTMTNGYFTTGGTVNLGTGENANGTLNISGGIFNASNTLSVATGTGSTGIINMSGGEMRLTNLKLGRKSAGDSAQLNLSGGILEITSGLYGSDSSPSGNVYITGTGQLLMNSSYSNATYAAIRELGKLYIEGSGDGSGALRFLQSSDSSVPITLTNDATIGIRTDAVFIQRETIESYNSGTKLTVKGGGTLNLLKQANHSGGTIIDSSVVKLSNTATLGSGAVTMTNGTLEFGYDEYHAFDNTINGTGSLVKSGAGTTVLSAANAFTGKTHIKQGTLQFNDDAAAVYGPVTVEDEGVLTYNINSQSKTLNYSDDVNIRGAGSFVKSGSGTLVLNGKHAYNGTTTVSGGVLQLTAQDAIAKSSVVTIESGSINMGAKQTLNNLSGYGAIENGGFDLTVNNTANTTFDGDITGSGSLTKTGTGTLKLAGYNNQYTGNTTVSEGTLVVASNSSLLSPLVTVTSGGTFQNGAYEIGSNIIVDGGSFVIGETPQTSWITVGNFALNNGGQISFDLNRYIDGATSQDDMDWLQAGTVSLNSGIINLSFNEGELDWLNNATDSGYLLITANSLSLDLDNVKVYVDNEESTLWRLATVNDELLLIRADGPIPVSEYWYANQASDMEETTWPIDHDPKLGVKFTKGLSQTADYTGEVQLTQDGSFEVGEGYDLTLSGGVTGSATMDKTGDGTLTLSTANNNFTGATKVSAGTLALTAQNAISNSASVENNGAITMSAAQSLNNLSGTGTIDNGGSALTLNNTAASEFSGVISGEGALLKTGADTLTLSGANNYSGATTINEGTLRLTGAGTIGTGGVTNNAIFEFSPAAGETMSITYNINNAAEASKTVKTGAGTLTTSAWINHNVEIKEGTLQITGGIGGNNGKRFNGTVTIDPGATLDCATHDSLGYGASNTVMNIYGTIDTSAGNETLKYTNFHFYGGTAKASGGGTYDICHTNSNFYAHALEGATAENPTVSTVSAGIRLRNSGDGDTFEIVTDANSQLNITGTIINYETQGVNCPIVKKGEGTLFFTARSTYKGGLTIEEGKVISNAANAGASTYGTGKIVIESKGTLEFQVSNQLGYDTGAPNDIIIRGTFIPSNYTHIKNLTLENGVIEKEYGYSDSGSGMDFRNRTATITSTGNSVIKSRFCIRSNSNVTFDVKDGVLTVEAGINNSTEETVGSAGYTKKGAGTLKITATGTSTGAANINEGTLLLTSSATMVSNVNVAAGATFVDGSNYITSAVTLNGGTLTIGETSSTARIVIGDFAVTNGTVNFDFNSASVDYNFDNLSTGAATLTSGIINLTFNNDDENTWWTNVTDSGYSLINASALTADLDSIQLLVNSETTDNWYLATADNKLLLMKSEGPEPPTPTDYYYRANSADDIAADKWTIDGTDKKGVKFTEGEQNTATYANPVELNANGSFEISENRNLTVAGSVSGAGAMEKTGEGTLTLSGANTYSGGTTITEGTLKLTDNGTLGSGAVVNNANLEFAHDSDQTFSNSFSGTGTIFKTGEGTLTLNSTANNSIGCDFVIDNGEVVLSNKIDDKNRFTKSVTINEGGKLTCTAQDSMGYAGGEATYNIFGGTLSLEGYNETFQNKTVNMKGGYITSNGDGASHSIGIFNNGTTFNALAADGATLENPTVSYVQAPISLRNTSDFDVTVAENAQIVFEKEILQGLNSAKPIVKKGEGVMTLSGNNTYTADTKVSQGTLQLTGDAIKANSSIEIADGAALEYKVAANDERAVDYSAGSKTVSGGNVVKTGAGKLKIKADGTQFSADNFAVSAGELDFKGQYNGDLTVARGATLSPGNSVGDLTVYGNVIIDAGATGLFEFSAYNEDPALQSFDKLTIADNGSFVIDPNSIIKLYFEGNDANLWAAEGAEYKLVSDEDFVSETTDMSGLLGNFTSLFGLEGRTDGLYLIALDAPIPPEPGSGVPEPSTWALLILGAVGLLFWRKRK